MVFQNIIIIIDKNYFYKDAVNGSTPKAKK